jgi:hypothetical protein
VAAPAPGIARINPLNFRKNHRPSDWSPIGSPDAPSDFGRQDQVLVDRSPARGAAGPDATRIVGGRCRSRSTRRWPVWLAWAADTPPAASCSTTRSSLPPDSAVLGGGPRRSRSGSRARRPGPGRGRWASTLSAVSPPAPVASDGDHGPQFHGAAAGDRSAGSRRAGAGPGHSRPGCRSLPRSRAPCGIRATRPVRMVEDRLGDLGDRPAPGRSELRPVSRAAGDQSMPALIS